MSDKNRSYKIVWIGIPALLIAFAAGNLAGYKRGILFVDRVREWSIGVYTGPSLLEIGDPGGVSNPVLTRDDVTDVAADFVADPFILRTDNGWCMFFEVLNSETRQGDIGLARSTDGLVWEYDRIVLDEPFHLSYPYVFEWEGRHYMIPESYEAAAVRLYEARDFPTKWAFVARLVRDDLVDPSVFRHAGRWWMLASANARGNDKLALYHAEELTGPWERHPASPLIIGDPNIARPAGRVIRVDEKLYRFGQDDHPSYALSVGAFEMTKLTLTEYEERPVKVPFLEGSGSGWNALGMHHIDAHRLPDGSWIAAVDGHRKVSLFGLQY